MNKKLCITLDLEPDYGGQAPTSYECWDIEKLDNFFAVLKKHKVKLTVFIVGHTLEEKHPLIQKFVDLNCEFALHSYAHLKNDPDSINEIRKGKIIFKRYFGKEPTGYRAPWGLISKKGLVNLSKEGFQYDSSIFPSFLPNIKNFFSPREPHYIKGLSLLEIPFATLRFIRLTISLSWIKLLGWPLFRFFLIFPKPHVLVFDSHMHDLITPQKKFTQLSSIWQKIYRRNKNEGIKLFERFIEYTEKKGYEMIFMKDVYTNTNESNLKSKAKLTHNN